MCIQQNPYSRNKYGLKLGIFLQVALHQSWIAINKHKYNDATNYSHLVE